jgi:hypothetical protein
MGNKIIAWFRIPRGYYCHTQKSCPYHSIRDDKPYQENGYCSYLGKGDWDLNDEIKDKDVEVEYRQKDGSYKKVMMKYGDLPPTSLLWDMCKECGVKSKSWKEIISFGYWI